MKYTLPIIVSTILLMNPCRAVESSPIGNAIEDVKADSRFGEFAKIVIDASSKGDADTIEKYLIIGDAKASWEATKMGLQMMKNMKIKSATFDIDKTKREYEKKGAKWNLSAPADGEMTITFKIEPQDGDLGDETKVRYMVAKTAEGWRVVLPTTKK